MKEKTRLVQYSAMLRVLVQLMTLPVYRTDPALTTRPLISTAARAHTHTGRTEEWYSPWLHHMCF